jgi:hypothetical protein
MNKINKIELMTLDKLMELYEELRRISAKVSQEIVARNKENALRHQLHRTKVHNLYHSPHTSCCDLKMSKEDRREMDFPFGEGEE